MSESAQNLNQLLREIEKELISIDLWTRSEPDPKATSSDTPVRHEAIPFEHWIQWVMIPTFDEILSKGGKLPEYCEITPMAELAFADITKKAEHLLHLIQQLDDLINKQSVTIQ